MKLNKSANKREFEPRPVRAVTSVRDILPYMAFYRVRGKLPPHPKNMSQAARYWLARIIKSNKKFTVNKIVRHFDLKRTLFRNIDNNESLAIPSPSNPIARAKVLQKIEKLMDKYSYMSPGEICPRNLKNTYEVYGNKESQAEYKANADLFIASAVQMTNRSLKIGKI